MIRHLLEPIQALHRRIRDDVVSATERAALDRLSDVHADDEGDTIYAIDKVAEDVLVGEVDRTIARVFGGVILVAEGLHGGRVVLPEGTPESAAKWLVIVDPIDGTRGLMYQKRPAWILTGVAPLQPDQPNQPDATRRNLTQPDQPRLSAITLAVQTEIPLVKQHLSDELWAMAGHGATGTRGNRLTGERQPLPLRPSSETTLAHGFSTIARFFPGVRADLAALDDELAETLLGPPVAGKAQFFEDQYICTGGQLYELIVGHDRFVADLRSVVPRTGHAAPSTARGTVHGAPGTASRPLTCHPYDLCTELIARECGVVVTDERGQPLSAPLNVEADVSWIGYANPSLRSAIEPVLAAKLRARGWVA